MGAHHPGCAVVRMGDLRAWCDCEGDKMTDDLIEAVALTIKAEFGKQMNAQPIHPDPAVDDWAGTGGEINLTAIAASVCGLFTDLIEAQAAEIEDLKQSLEIWIFHNQRAMGQKPDDARAYAKAWMFRNANGEEPE